MRRSRFSEAHVVGLRKEHQDGLGVADLRRRYAISDAKFYKWRPKSGRLGGVGAEAASKAGRGERHAEATIGGRDVRRIDEFVEEWRAD